MHRDDALKIIYDAIDTVNRQQPEPQRLPKSPETVIVGPSGRLDSLGIVNLILAIEDRAHEWTGIPIRLLDEGSLIDDNGPFRDVGALARLLETRAGTSKQP